MADGKKNKACLNMLEILFGLKESDLGDLFKQVDLNNNGLVNQTEVLWAMDELLRRGGGQPTMYGR